MKINSSEDIRSFIESQLDVWPEAHARYIALGSTERRALRFGDEEIYLQCNPARIASTAAKVDASSIARRKCFLCAENRPEEQVAIDYEGEWDILLNPFPILPVHFTIASKSHRPQRRMPADAIKLALEMPSLAIFFNGARAGASAPDHLHLQAVLASEIPAVNTATKHHHNAFSSMKLSSDFAPDFPATFVSIVARPDSLGNELLLRGLRAFGIDKTTHEPDACLVNSFIWRDIEGIVRMIIFPRSAHRPSCYNATGSHQRLVSPGALDMAGIVVCPRIDDFRALTKEEITEIYAQTSMSAADIRQLPWVSL